MGLINFAKGEGSQAIQLFGRGVRLRGYKGCLKRSRGLEDITPPKNIQYLERLTIFGIKADYMSVFKDYLQKEDMAPNDNIREFTLPVVSRFDDVKNKGLKVLKLKDGMNFIEQARRITLSAPDADIFEDYMLKNKVIINCYVGVQSLVSSFDSFEMMSQKEECKLPKESLAFINYEQVYFKLQRHKSEKGLYNLTVDIDRIKAILSENYWYTLLIPKSELFIDSMDKVVRVTEISIMLLKRYLEKFYKYEKAKWESPYLVYGELKEKDNNFVDEYTISLNGDEKSFEAIEVFINDLKAALAKDKGLNKYNNTWGSLTAFDFRNHLYAPLIAVKSGGLKLDVTPVSLNDSEKEFVDLLKEYCESNVAFFDNKELYLLRNKSKVGMGFFEAGNFYPDYILWMVPSNTFHLLILRE